MQRVWILTAVASLVACSGSTGDGRNSTGTGGAPSSSTGDGPGNGGAGNTASSADTGGTDGNTGTATSSATATDTLPEEQSCVLNCCNGLKKDQGDLTDSDQCIQLADAAGTCDLDGGPAKVLFGGKTAWQSLTCPGNCFAGCCDGSVAYTDEKDQDECELAAGAACRDDRGGPSAVAYSTVLLWTASGQCPSLRECTLACADGQTLTTMQYQAKVCIALSVGALFCDMHGGSSKLYFDGQEVWSAP